ncbi:MAG TPA: MoaD/ThiS family protein [Gemmatimonadaceae bacterium]|nr:MoaD/ThiS family protein [Gemmatimonadaceae bacterium]
MLLFASWADALGGRAVDVEVAEGATADDVIAALTARTGGARLPRPALAINRQLARGSDPVQRGDEVAVIPPVAGG